MPKQKINFRNKPLALSLVIVPALILIAGYLGKILTASDYFKINEVVIKASAAADLAYLKGRNIFSVNLAEESRRLAVACPDCLKVEVMRVIPDRIFVEFIRRRPVALIKLSRYFAVDQQGALFRASSEPQNFELPLITGLEGRISGVREGEITGNRELRLILAIIREIKRTALWKDYPVRRIDAGGPDGIRLYLAVSLAHAAYVDWRLPGSQKLLEIKISQGNIAEKVAIISGLLRQEKESLANVRYIDLRFNEPVIKFK